MLSLQSAVQISDPASFRAHLLKVLAQEFIGYSETSPLDWNVSANMVIWLVITLIKARPQWLCINQLELGFFLVVEFLRVHGRGDNDYSSEVEVSCRCEIITKWNDENNKLSIYVIPVPQN